MSTIEEGSAGRSNIVVTELPYQVNKARLAEKVADLVRTGKIKDIADVRDESNREGMRLVIVCKRGANAQVVLNQLYKQTQLQENFGIIMLALVDDVPRTLNLAEMVGYYVDHQVDVVTRRTEFDKRKAEERDHIVQGLLIALDHLDEVIAIIRGSQDAEEARTKLMKKFKLSEIQANHILDMPLRRLTRLAREELEAEHEELLKRIKYLTSLLKDPKKLRGVIKDELAEIRKKHANARRTKIRADEGEFDVEDLIAEEDVVITVSRAGYVKRLPVDAFRRQGRGGKGVRGANLKEEDVIKNVFTTTTHHWLLFFTTKGKVYRVKAHEVPEVTRQARGLYAANLAGVQVSADERVQRRARPEGIHGRPIPAVRDEERHGQEDRPARVRLASHRPRRHQPEGRRRADRCEAHDGTDDVFLVSRKGQTIRFKESLARPMGRATAGVIGMRLAADDEVLELAIASEGEEMISVTRNGYGKRSKLADYPAKGRGGKGVIGHQITTKTGQLAGAFIGSKDQDLLTISSTGKVQRVAAEEIRRVGRSSQGVRTMRVEPGENVAAIAPVVLQMDEE